MHRVLFLFLNLKRQDLYVDRKEMGNKTKAVEPCQDFEKALTHFISTITNLTRE